VPALRRIGLLSIIPDGGSHSHKVVVDVDADNDKDCDDDSGKSIIFSPRVMKKRLEIFLQVFSAVTSPKQLYMHNMLYQFYLEIIAKSDAMTVKLAVDCILTYRSPSIIPYKDSIKRFLDDKTIRNELLNFDPTLSSKLENAFGMDDNESHILVRDEHRDELIPMIVRLVYGRFTSKARGSKAARDLNIARRAAVLAFVSKMESGEIRHLIHLMLRGLLPLHRLSTPTLTTIELTSYDSYSIKLQSWYDQIDTLILLTMSSIDLVGIPWERSIGFLHLLQPMIRILGFTVTDFIPIIYKVVLVMLTYAQHCRDKVKDLQEKEDVVADVDNDDDNDDDRKDDDDRTNIYHRDAGQALRLRSLSLLRIAGK